MKTPIQEFYEFMEQNQYFIGNDLYGKYKELLEKEREVMCDFAEECIENADVDVDFFAVGKLYDKTFNNK